MGEVGDIKFELKSFELAARVALISVRIPAADVGESDFQADVGFDQLSRLLQCTAKGRVWILNAGRRHLLLRSCAAEHFDGVKGVRISNPIPARMIT